MVRKLFLYIIMFGSMLAVLEAFAFVLQFVIDRDDLFDHRKTVLARLNSDDLAFFLQKGGDPVLGWKNYGPLVSHETNCLGTEIEYRFDTAGARLHSRFDPVLTEVVVVGDSYTNGAEVGDDETYPAQLSRLLNISVANHGVGGYGPAQSFLGLKQNISRYPQAKIVVMGIMYENLYRMVNSYRPVLYSTSSDYTLKPFMAAGEIVPHPGMQAYEDIKHFNQAANRSFDNDFWAKPEASFPYMASLVEALGSNYFIYRRLQKLLRKLGYPEYFLIFQDEEIRSNLTHLLNRYAEYVVGLGLQPVVIFIPRNRLDTRSASRYIDQSRDELHPDLLIGDVGAMPGVDWNEFNSQEPASNNICHPSTYGYQAIAEYIAEFIQAKKIWPAH